MPKTSLTKDFQCVTGWRVPEVHWEGVLLSDVLDRGGVEGGGGRPLLRLLRQRRHREPHPRPGAPSRRDRRLPMLGAPITTEHGGPVRLYVAPMFGYKSLKWLSGIRVVDQVEPGFWEQNGYPVDGWIDGSTDPAVGQQRQRPRSAVASTTLQRRHAAGPASSPLRPGGALSRTGRTRSCSAF